MAKFYRKDGRLTVYSFACGYGESYNGGWHAEGGVTIFLDGVWHVRSLTIPDPSRGGRGVWESFDTLDDARKFARTFGKFTPASDAFSGK